MLHSVLAAIVVAVVGLTIVDGAAAQGRRAQPSEDDPAGYKQAIGTAISEFDRNNYAEAREHFARAHGLYPNARTLRGMGMTEFELKNYVEATQYLEQALASVIRPLEGRLREETEKLLASARQYVGTLRLTLDPPTASVSIDGLPVQLDAQNGVRLEVGDHLVELRAEGRLSERRAIQTRGEQVLALNVRLSAPEAASAGPESAPRAPLARSDEPRTPVYKRWWLWTTVGVLAAGGAVAAILLTRRVEHPEEPTTTPNTPPNASLQPLWSR